MYISAIGMQNYKKISPAFKQEKTKSEDNDKKDLALAFSALKGDILVDPAPPYFPLIPVLMAGRMLYKFGKNILSKIK